MQKVVGEQIPYLLYLIDLVVGPRKAALPALPVLASLLLHLDSINELVVVQF